MTARTKTRPPAKTAQVLVRLTPADAADLHRLAAQQGISPAAVLRAGLTLIQMTEAARMTP